MREAGVDFLEVLAFADGLRQSGDLGLLELQDPELLAIAKVAGQLGDRALLQIKFLQVGNQNKSLVRDVRGMLLVRDRLLSLGSLLMESEIDWMKLWLRWRCSRSLRAAMLPGMVGSSLESR